MTMKKNDFLNLIDNLSATAKKGRWEFFYDKLADSLYWSKNKVSPETRLKKLSRETSLYMNPSGAVEGLMIQYFRNNFLAHNENLAKTSILKSIDKTENGEQISFGSKKDELEALFSESVKSDILKDALEANYTLKDLDKVFRVSVRA